MTFFYHATAQRPTAVVASCTGHFTGPDDLNLIVAKNTYLELYDVSAEGLKLLKELPIFGKISAMKMFSRNGNAKQTLFIITQKAESATIECQKDEDGNLVFVTVASGNFEDRAAQILEKGHAIYTDPDNNLLIIHYFVGLLKVIQTSAFNSASSNPTGDGGFDVLLAQNVRLENPDIVDMAFLHGYKLPTFVIIYQDPLGVRCGIYEISAEYRVNPLQRNTALQIEPDSRMLIPIASPYGGFVVVGMQSVAYQSKEEQIISQQIPQTNMATIMCYGVVDEFRYLLGDLSGRLYMLHLVLPENRNRITSLQLEVLGNTTIPECITYLDNGVLFVGSLLGDSQLIRLNPEGDEKTGYVNVLETYTNVGPIIDMVVQNNEKQGQTSLITASGAFQEGSLRVVRSGIGIHERASIDEELIKAVWCFGFHSKEFDDTIITSLVGRTLVMQIQQDDIEPITLPGFEVTLQTYHCALVSPNLVLQVTSDSLRLVSTLGEGLRDEWRPVSGRSVSHCASHSEQLVVASGADLCYLRVQGEKFLLVSSYTLSHEAACLDLTPFRVDDSKEPLESKLVAIGLWMDFSLVLLTLPDLKPLLKESLNSNVIPRSLLIAQFDLTPYVFVALGDGTLVYYVLDTKSGCLRDSKRVSVGTGPMCLRQWQTQHKTSVFVCSNHPCIIYSSNGKLVFANVNLKEVIHMCPLNSECYTDCMALVSSSCLMFGSVDDLQKLHVRSLSLEETPKRLCLQEETRTLGLITYRYEHHREGRFTPVRTGSVSLQTKAGKSQSKPPKMPTPLLSGSREGSQVQVSSLLILDESTLEVLHSHTFHYSASIRETALCVCSCRFEGSGDIVFCVGSAFIVEEDVEPRVGRITIFRWTEGSKLETLLEHNIGGAPYDMTAYNGKLLVVVNSQVYLFSLAGEKLLQLATYGDSVVSIYLKKKGDFILVGDIMRSIFLLMYSSRSTSLELIAKHISPRWTTAMEILDDDHFLASEAEHNLYVVAKETPLSGANSSESAQLVECAGFHTGEFINVFRPGSLTMQQLHDASLPITSPHLYGCVSGAIGMLCQVTGALFQLLHDLQVRLASTIKGVGCLPHEAWRAVRTDRQVKMSENFVDGDLVELFLDLSQAEKEQVLSEMKIATDLTANTVTPENTRPCDVEEMVKIVEELSRLH